MEFEISKALNNIRQAWDHFNFHHERYKNQPYFYLNGPKGSGKTKIAQAYVHAHAYAFYFSFGDLPYPAAIREIAKLHLPQSDNIQTITEALQLFLSKRQKRPTLIFLEDESSPATKEAFDFLINCARSQRNLMIWMIGTSPEPDITQHEVFIQYLSVADYCRLFPSFSRNDVMRLHALTGGIPTIAKELDPDASYEENVKRLFRYDSAFSVCLSRWVIEVFRSPESYYPLLESIAAGHHRLSEIAKQVGFPNNKCGKYLEALIRHGFVIAEKTPGTKQATYHLANSYFIAWCRYAYGKQMVQIQSPEILYEFVSADIDPVLTLPAFHSACMRFIQNSWRRYFDDFLFRGNCVVEKNVRIRLRDKSEIVFDYCIKTDEKTLICIFPHELEIRYTKETVERIYEAVSKYVLLYDSELVLFSVQRFSDWCVHEASIRKFLHEVTIERLRF
ncbi:hypothetical protein IKP13_00090 [bacterium]|nr:hypothetical protein [bacterium]